MISLQSVILKENNKDVSMKESKIFTVIILLLICFSVIYSEVDFNGNILTDNRIRLDDHIFTWNEIRLISQLNYGFGKGHMYSEILLKGTYFPKIIQSNDLQNIENINLLEINIKETYIDFYEFISKNLDIRIGKQRIAWGTADKLNPTDNLNPDNLEDIMDFGNKISSHAIKLTYYLGDYSLEGVFIPVFTPAILPSDEWMSAFFSSLPIPENLILQSYSDTVIIPQKTFKENSMFAVKLSGNILKYDFSVSYFNGRDDIPLINNITITPISPTLINADVQMMYPKMQVIGADFSGQIGDIGIWGEGACFIPEKVTMEMTTIGVGTDTSLAINSIPYYKYVIGADYTFKNGLYFNGQYLHGFIQERGKNSLNDYIILAVEKKFFDDLQIRFGFGAEIEDYKNVKNSSAFSIMPEISYFPMDNGEIDLGAYLINGTNNTNFGKVEMNDELYLKFKYYF